MSTYCCSDLHGCYHLWKQIQNYLKSDDKLIFLGDAIDRQPHGMTILKEMMEDSRVTCLLGNHEDLMYYAASNCDPEWTNICFNDWMNNGGFDSANIFTKMTKKTQNKLLDFIQSMDVLYPYYNEQGQLIYLSHAGFTPNPHWTKEQWNALEYSTNLYWDREHIKDEWPKEYDNVYVVHGHTPVPYLTNIVPKTKEGWQIFNYCDNHKIDIDLMSFDSGVAALLNLDTWMVTYFYDSTINPNLGN